MLLFSSVDTQSIRLNRIQAVSASHGWMSGKITIDIGARLIVIDDCLKTDVKVFAKLANQLIREQDENSNASFLSNDSIADEIGKLNELHVKGILTDREFAEAKAKLIAMI